MALEAGGYAEKLGNRYEANWIAYQLIRLLQEKINYLTVEPIGDDEIGVDLVIGNNDDSHEHHQCKASSGNSESWSLSKLYNSGIIKNADYQIRRGATEFHLVSPLSNRVISDLCESALNSNAIPLDFLEHQVKQSQEREKCFNSLCEYLGLSVELEEDIRKAITFLQRFKIIRYDLNKHNQSELEDKASLLFSGPSVKLVQFLKYYPVEYNKLRNKITANQLLIDLKKAGFVSRGIPEDERILSVIENLSREFGESIQPFLICNKIINRAELNSIIKSIDDSPVTLLRAEAGVGKSSLLLELHNHLRSSGAISVPVRLDRRNPEHNLDAYGRTLGFPYSPPLSLSALSKHNKVVIILDQLDAIRWTGTHSNIALHICQELIRQTIALREEGSDISVVLASRDFELNEDIALSSWLDSISDSLNEVSLSTLDEEIVDELVSPFETYSSLSLVKKEILKIPLWLGIYLAIAGRTEAAPKFDNKLELVKNFWDDRLSQTCAHNLSIEEAERFIDKLVSIMMKQGSMSAPLSALPVGSQWTLDVLMSIGVLTKQDQRVSFRHQALYDYQVGSKLYRAGTESPEKLLSVLGGLDNQTLDKREHLRYALNMLLDSNQKNYCSSIETILFSDEVRFHLKFLALNSLKDLKAIKSPARKLINKLVEDPKLSNKFISTSCYKNTEIIEYLINNRFLGSWLNSEDDKLVGASIGLISSISEIKPSLLVTTLLPYVDVSDSWNQKIYNSLCWKMEDDSDEMFELRKVLIQKGCSIGYIDWRGLSKRHPKRALSLIEFVLEHYRGIVCKPKYSDEVRAHEKLTQRDNWSITELDQILSVADAIPETVISRLLKKIDDIAESQTDRESVLVWLHKDEACEYDHDCHFTFGLFSLVEKAGKTLRSEPERLLDLVSPYLSKTNPVTTHLVARLLLNLSKNESNNVIDWLLEYPDLRLACGNTYQEPIWVLPGKLIKKFSDSCSLDRFTVLEKRVCELKTYRSIDEVRRKLETRKSGFYPSYWGQAQHFLLPQLAKEKVADSTHQMIEVLIRKFESHSYLDFCLKFETTGGRITSPIPRGNKLSDRCWTRLILTPGEHFNEKRWKQVEKDIVAESSVEQFSRSLERAVCNEPTRFANLALMLPKDIDPRYVSAFFRGLAESSIEKTHDDYKDDWVPCSDSLLESVISHFPHVECEHALVGLLDSRSFSLETKSFHILLQLARHAKDPESNKLNIWNSDKGRSTAEASPKSLMENSINCVRGQAYIAIAKIFFKNESLADKNRDVVAHAIGDKHPAVNMSALELLKPYLNYDSAFAHTKFIELCAKDIRVSGGYGASYFFNQGFESDHVNEYVELVLRMLDSQYLDVRKEAARQIYARWFLNYLFEGELDFVLKGDKDLKSGCASVLSQFLREDNYHDRISKIESSYVLLINDDDKDILKQVGRCVQYENYWGKHNSKLLFNEFVKSKAVTYCIYELFNKLESFPGMLVDMSSSILELVNNIVEIETHDDPVKYRLMNIHESSFLSVLQRIYDEATEDEDDDAIINCLDIWDKLLNSEIYTAMNVVKGLDNGLLS